MATLTLDRDETGSDFLPPRCMRCGRETEEYMAKNFVWSHPALILLVLLGLIGVVLMIILRAVTAKRVTVDVPVCPRHRHLGALNTAVVALILIADVAVVVVMAVASKDIEARIGGAAFGAMVIGLLVSIPVMIVVSVYKIRATKIDADEIQLAGVNAGFADEVREKQRAELEAYRARRKAKRDAEPIYDDDPVV